MRLNYKRLGDYIRKVNVRNTDLKVTRLFGVSIQKILIPSIANTVGTNMKNYKILLKNQFAYGPVTSRNGDKISIALMLDYDEAIISQAYTVFDVIDKEKLDPEYLMMWFRRPEFDRYARFKSHGSARETFDWEEMCEVELPVPSIEKQRAIVKEYNTIVNRIKLNEQLNQKLEETAQAIYKHWFVDFEFPDENGEPYKSSGGEMVYNEELDRDVPIGWEVNRINCISDISSSKRVFFSEYVDSGIPFYRGKEISIKKSGKPVTDGLYISKARYSELKTKYGKPLKGDILLTAVGTIGVSYWVEEEEFYFKDGNVIWFKNFKKDNYSTYLYALMQSILFKKIIEEITIGSTQSAITITSLGDKKIVVPPPNLLKKFESNYKTIHANISRNNKINIVMYELRTIVLSKMSVVESAKSESII